MCQTFEISPGNNGMIESYESLGELRGVLGRQNVIMSPYDTGSPDEFCCCGVNAKATAKASGYQIRDTPFGVLFWRTKKQHIAAAVLESWGDGP